MLLTLCHCAKLFVQPFEGNYKSRWRNIAFGPGMYVCLVCSEGMSHCDASFTSHDMEPPVR